MQMSHDGDCYSAGEATIALTATSRVKLPRVCSLEYGGSFIKKKRRNKIKRGLHKRFSIDSPPEQSWPIISSLNLFCRCQSDLLKCSGQQHKIL